MRLTLHELCERLNRETDAIHAYETEIAQQGYCTPRQAWYLQGHRNELRDLERRAIRRADYRRIVLEEGTR